MSRPVPRVAADLVKRFEGYRSVAYLCPAGVWTAGWGHTGVEIVQGVTCTKRQAELWLREDLAKAGRRLEARIGKVAAELTDNQYAALLSFVFNLGSAPDWTIWKRLKARDFDAVPGQLVRFVNAGGKKLPGLVRRRNAEVELWSTDEPGSEDRELPSSTTRAVETPPAPAAKPATTPVVTALVGACGAVPVAAQQVTATIAPYAEHSEIVGKVVAIVATIAAAAAVAMLVLTWWQRRQAVR